MFVLSSDALAGLGADGACGLGFGVDGDNSQALPATLTTRGGGSGGRECVCVSGVVGGSSGGREVCGGGGGGGGGRGVSRTRG